MRFDPKSFVRTVKDLLEAGEKALETLVDAYLWAGHHLKEIHRVNPEYEQRWLLSEVRRIFNVDVPVFARTAKKLGGGSETQNFEEGKAVIAKFGVYETFRAEKLLTDGQMETLRKDITPKTTPDEFRQMVDQHSRHLEKLREEREQPKTFAAVLKENLQLKKQLEVAHKEIERLRQKLDAASKVLI
jgi:hypothetical protein